MENFIVIVANVCVIGILAAVAFFFNWSGPGFVVGFLSGGVAYALYMRLKLGYWV
jgi:hypothetical protein